jgi:hypothetical protein
MEMTLSTAADREAIRSATGISSWQLGKAEMVKNGSLHISAITGSIKLTSASAAVDE